jgi:pilus assembly protein CpaB
MLKRRGIGLIALSLLLAFGAALLARNWMQARMRSDDRGSHMPVVIASMEIPFGTRVESRQIRVITLPPGTPLASHFSRPDAVIGLIATQKILAGEILLRDHFTQRPVGSSLAAVLKPNLRAIAVRVDDVVGVAGFLLPGNHVDVVATHIANQHAETKTILRNLTVLAVDQTASQDKTTPVVVRAVTLEVTPAQAEILVQAREQGSIQLTLRSPTAADDATASMPTTFPVAAPSPVTPAARALSRDRRQNPARLSSRPERPRSNGTTIIRGTIVQHTPPSH